MNRNELYHYGVKGMKWGVRRYQNYDGTLINPKRSSFSERRAAKVKAKFRQNAEKIDSLYAKADANLNREEKNALDRYIKNSIKQDIEYYKKHYPELSDKEAAAFAQQRAEALKKAAIITGAVGIGALIAYGAVKYGRDYADQTIKAGTSIQTLSYDPERLNKGQAFYAAFKGTDKNLYTGKFSGDVSNGLKFAITKTAKVDLKIASAKTGERVFNNLLKNDSEFKDSFEKLTKYTNWKKLGYKTEYDWFNARLLPLDDTPDSMLKTFYGELKKQNYSGLIDLNDSRYSKKLKTKSPVVMFDQSNLGNQSIRKLTSGDVLKGRAASLAIDYGGEASAIVSALLIAGGISKSMDKKIKAYIASKKNNAGDPAIKHSDELYHHGILNQKWGVRNGPPYPLGGGDYSESEKRAIYKERKKKNSIYNKRHFDTVMKKGTVLSTLSYDQNRTKNVDMFYAAHTKLDKHEYNALFNRPIPKPILDDDGNEIGTGQCLKYRINNETNTDVKIASEDSGAEAFRQLYKKDRDFYNFVTDPDRMQGHFVKDKYKFRGYRESRSALEKLRSGKPVNAKDLQKIYRMFNYVIPSDGGGDARKGGDVAKQRAKFFKALKDAGYGAVLDTNDAIYGGFKATSPVIVFDQEKVFLKNVEETTLTQQRFSKAVTVGRKALGI